MVEMTIDMKMISKKRKELLLTLRDMIASIRTQNGCVSCSACLGMESNQLISLNICWDSRKSMDDYQASRLFSALLGAIRLLCVSYQITVKTVLSVNGLNNVER